MIDDSMRRDKDGRTCITMGCREAKAACEVQLAVPTA